MILLGEFYFVHLDLIVDELIDVHCCLQGTILSCNAAWFFRTVPVCEAYCVVLFSEQNQKRQHTGEMEDDASLTFDPSMSMSTKLGFTSSVTLLYAPVADPGLMRNLPSYETACRREHGHQLADSGAPPFS